MTIYLHSPFVTGATTLASGTVQSLSAAIESAAVAAGRALYVDSQVSAPSVLQDSSGRIAGLLDADGSVAMFPNYAVDATGNVTGVATPGGVTGSVIAVGASRSLTAADNGNTLDCTAAGITLTIPSGVLLTLGVVILPNSTTSVASSDGTLLNGATSTIARTATLNGAFAVIPRTTANSYVVTGD
jgi:hypothetical protein